MLYAVFWIHKHFSMLSKRSYVKMYDDDPVIHLYFTHREVPGPLGLINSTTVVQQ